VAKKKRAALRQQRATLFQKFHTDAKTGIHTGRLRRSLVYGRPESPEDQTCRVEGNKIVVGSALKYAKWFAKRRPIASKTTLTPARRAVLLAIMKTHVQNELRRQGLNA
jgi:hypothetical protein